MKNEKEDAGGDFAVYLTRAVRQGRATSSPSTITWHGADSEWMGQIYKIPRPQRSVIVHGLDEPRRKEAISRDITDGQNETLDICATT